MLPNWLYGKSKSKLASILGGGGTPADYNQVKAQVTQNTENIELLSDDLDTKAALTQITNPNLLYNPWFTVNQRGMSSYTQGTSYAYTVDRWRMYNMTLSVSSDGITLTPNDSTLCVFSQLIENFDKLIEKTVTISAVINGQLYSATGVFPTKPSSGANRIAVSFGLDTLQLTFGASDSYPKFEITTYDTAAITIKALKFELGSVSTLAMDTAPDMALELAKCQRYFQRIGVGTSNIWLAMGNGYNGNANFIIPIAPMRANPTLTYANVTLASVQTTSVAIASKTGERYDALRSRCHLTLTYNQSAFTEAELPLGIYAAANSGGHLDFDAEL